MSASDSIVIGRGGMVVTVQPALLIAACASRGWSIAELGRQAGLSRPTLRKVLHGQSVWPRTAWKIRRALAQAESATDFDAKFAVRST
ncbi:MAG: hypothetical protein ACREEC_08980 [Thermoplasmata archaeon]